MNNRWTDNTFVVPTLVGFLTHQGRFRLKAVLQTLLPLVVCPSLAFAQDSIRLIPAKDKELQLLFAATTNLSFVCAWDASKKPTVLEFNGRIDTPTRDASTGGPVDLLRIELNGVLLDGSRLLNKPLTSPRSPLISSEVVWFTEPHWGLMYCGSWTPPDNEYTPKQGSPVRFVLDVSNTIRANATNTLTLTYRKSMVGEQTLAEHCRAGGLGDATVVLGELQVRPRKESDAFQPKKD